MIVAMRTKLRNRRSFSGRFTLPGGDVQRLVSVLLLLLVFGVTQAQAQATKEEYMKACLAGALKDPGCPRPQPPTDPGQQLVIPPTPDPAPVAPILGPPITFAVPATQPAPAPVMPAPDETHIVVAPPPAIVPLKPILLNRNDKRCGPAIPPYPIHLTPQYVMNRNRCLRSLRTR
jgi:hypothetical protein